MESYSKTYKFPINITRCSNNYGPKQHREKLIPLMIEKCLKNEKMPVYGDGLQVRDWLYVSDHCNAIDIVLHEGKEGEIYNIGGNKEVQNIEIVKRILKFLKKSETQINYVQDRLGHDRRYAVNSSKIMTTLKWKPEILFDNGLENTIEWYRMKINERADVFGDKYE